MSSLERVVQEQLSLKDDIAIDLKDGEEFDESGGKGTLQGRCTS